MVELERIGERIKEQRKHILKISQEKMAEDLMMYQADVSNLEKAKSGSGISDLMKLDAIAEYFNIPLETLLFGKEGKDMQKYQGDSMKLSRSKKKPLKSHLKTVRRLMGTEEYEGTDLIQHVCGPYRLYTAIEMQYCIGENTKFDENGHVTDSDFELPKLHTYVFYDTELVGVMVASVTYLMQYVFRPHLEYLKKIIPPDIFDVTEVIRRINPYWGLWNYSDEKKRQEIMPFMMQRMDEMREIGETKPVMLIESVYVREDCRKRGIFRMYTDMFKMEETILWLNMEPTSGNELDCEYTCLPPYSASELGQINMNAAIAEKVGYIIDSDTRPRMAETTDADGNIEIKPMDIRKYAYYLPESVRALIKNDGDLVEKGRALQKLAQSDEEPATVDINHGYIDEKNALEVVVTEGSGKRIYAYAVLEENMDMKFLVSEGSLLRDTDQNIIEQYGSLEEAEASENYEAITNAAKILTMCVMDDENESFDITDDYSK